MTANKGKNSITIGDITYKTSGNILFEDDHEFFLAESPILEKMDEVVRFGILENGMQLFLKKIKD